jgi:hypothetical protein
LSGGHFDYKQYQLTYLQDELEHLVQQHEEDVEKQPEEIIVAAAGAISLLSMAFVLIHRIDYFMSGDDGLEQFISRTQKELADLVTNRETL